MDHKVVQVWVPPQTLGHDGMQQRGQVCYERGKALLRLRGGRVAGWQCVAVKRQGEAHGVRQPRRHRLKAGTRLPVARVRDLGWRAQGCAPAKG
jgi:hypothetical protein